MRLAKVFHGLLDLLIRQLTMQDGNGLVLQSQSPGQLLLEELQRLYPLGEDHQAVAGVAAAPAPVLAAAQLLDQVLELTELLRADGLHQALQVAQPFEVRMLRVFILQFADALPEGLQARRRRGEQGLFQYCAEQHGTVASARAFTIQLEFGQSIKGQVLRRASFGGQAEDFTLGEVLLHLFAHVFLEAADEQVLDILTGVVRTGRQHRGIEHAHQAGEAVFLAVVRRSGE
ncbi:hypothetical protein D9M68_396730 [compost metagenome]